MNAPEATTGRRRSAMGLLLSWGLAGALLYWALRGVSISELLAACSDLSASEILLLLAVNVVALPVFGLRWWLILRVDRSHDTSRRVSLFETSVYRLAAFGLAYLTPGPLVGGEPLQVVLLERRHGYLRSEAIASVALDRVLELTVSFGALLAASSYLVVVSSGVGQADGASLIPGLAALALLVALPVTYLALLLRGRVPVAALTRRSFDEKGFLEGGRLLRIARTLAQSETLAANWLRAHPVQFTAALAISLLGFAITLFEFFLVVQFLALPATPTQALLAFVAARLAQFVLLPGALGALETSQLLSWRAAGVIDALGLTVSLVVRARDLLFASLGLVIGLLLLRSRSPKAETAEELEARPETPVG